MVRGTTIGAALLFVIVLFNVYTFLETQPPRSRAPSDARADKTIADLAMRNAGQLQSRFGGGGAQEAKARAAVDAAMAETLKEEASKTSDQRAAGVQAQAAQAAAEQAAAGQLQREKAWKLAGRRGREARRATQKAEREKAAALPRLIEPASNRSVLLRTSEGDLRITLRDDWHAPSTAAVRSLAEEHAKCTGRGGGTRACARSACTQCELYRVETGFLVQGTLRGSRPVNRETGCKPAPACQPGPRVMVRGDVGWAGGGAGPDFFV